MKLTIAALDALEILDSRGNPTISVRAVLSSGQEASPLVSLAESVSVREQNLIEFKSLLNRALAINPDARPEWRLVNLVMQRRARWLLARTDQLFLIPDANEK